MRCVTTAPPERPASGNPEVAARLDLGLERLGLAPTADRRAQLLRFLDLLTRWNRAYNLTAVRDPLEMVGLHLLDSLAVLPHLAGDRILDLGTGAGLPGLPLAILTPEKHFTLLDSNAKKLRFVRQVALELGLSQVETAQARIETYRNGQKFSTIVSRAVAAQALGGPALGALLDSPGLLLLMKGRRPEETSASLGLPDATSTVHELSVPFVDAPRHLLAIRSP